MDVSRSTSGRPRNDAAHVAHSTIVGSAVSNVSWAVRQSRIRCHFGRRETSNSTGFWLGARLAMSEEGGPATADCNGPDERLSATPIAAPIDQLRIVAFPSICRPTGVVLTRAGPGIS